MFIDSASAIGRWQMKGGAELLIVEGNLIEGNSIHAKGSWIRIPSGHGMAFIAGIDKTLVYLKEGHLDVEQVTLP